MVVWVTRALLRIITVHGEKTSGIDPEGFSVEKLRGSKASGNRGLLDMLVFKREALTYFFGALPKTLGLSCFDWLEQCAKPQLSTPDPLGQSVLSGEHADWLAGASRGAIS